MTHTRPAHAHNALDQVGVAVIFENDFEEALFEKIDYFKSLYADRLPDFNALKFLQMQFDDPTSSISGVGGFECSSAVEPDIDKAVWVLKVDKNSIVITCSKFISWTQMWNDTSVFLKQFLLSVDFGSNKIKELVLQCADLFLAPISNEYDISEVFDVDSIYLSKKLLSSGPSWHLNQGWFSFLSELSTPLLHNLNLSAITKSDNHMTVVDHISRMRSEDSFGCNDGVVDSLVDKISLIMRIAYDENMKIMRALLKDEIQKDIGLL